MQEYSSVCLFVFMCETDRQIEEEKEAEKFGKLCSDSSIFVILIHHHSTFCLPFNYGAYLLHDQPHV